MRLLKALLLLLSATTVLAQTKSSATDLQAEYTQNVGSVRRTLALFLDSTLFQIVERRAELLKLEKVGQQASALPIYKIVVRIGSVNSAAPTFIGLIVAKRDQGRRPEVLKSAMSTMQKDVEDYIKISAAAVSPKSSAVSNVPLATPKAAEKATANSVAAHADSIKSIVSSAQVDNAKQAAQAVPVNNVKQQVSAPAAPVDNSNHSIVAPVDNSNHAPVAPVDNSKHAPVSSADNFKPAPISAPASSAKPANATQQPSFSTFAQPPAQQTTRKLEAVQDQHAEDSADGLLAQLMARLEEQNLVDSVNTQMFNRISVPANAPSMAATARMLANVDDEDLANLPRTDSYNSYPGSYYPDSYYLQRMNWLNGSS